MNSLYVINTSLVSDQTKKRYGYVDLIAYALTGEIEYSGEDPKSFSEEKQQGIVTMEEKISSLYKNETGDMVEKPCNQRNVGSEWALKGNLEYMELNKPGLKQDQ